jgi:hypothetical protein
MPVAQARPSVRSRTPRGRLPDKAPSEAADAPAALEIGGIDVENIVLLEGARVEHDDVGQPEVAINAIEDTENVFAVRNVWAPPDLIREFSFASSRATALRALVRPRRRSLSRVTPCVPPMPCRRASLGGAGKLRAR